MAMQEVMGRQTELEIENIELRELIENLVNAVKLNSSIINGDTSGEIIETSLTRLQSTLRESTAIYFDGKTDSRGYGSVIDSILEDWLLQLDQVFGERNTALEIAIREELKKIFQATSEMEVKERMGIQSLSLLSISSAIDMVEGGIEWMLSSLSHSFFPEPGEQKDCNQAGHSRIQQLSMTIPVLRDELLESLETVGEISLADWVEFFGKRIISNRVSLLEGRFPNEAAEIEKQFKLMISNLVRGARENNEVNALSEEIAQLRAEKNTLESAVSGLREEYEQLLSQIDSARQEVSQMLESAKEPVETPNNNEDTEFTDEQKEESSMSVSIRKLLQLVEMDANVPGDSAWLEKCGLDQEAITLIQNGEITELSDDQIFHIGVAMLTPEGAGPLIKTSGSGARKFMYSKDFLQLVIESVEGKNTSAKCASLAEKSGIKKSVISNLLHVQMQKFIKEEYMVAILKSLLTA